ncbi:MAG: prephenate dehydrogenase/arogenate dehydrogenase family protein [Christensenellales bacterium]
MQNVGIVGLGLIGGSLAKTIKLHTPYTVYGTDKNADTMRRAFLMEAIDGKLTAETLPQCDVVLICLYPQGIIDYVTAHAADFNPDSLVIDCGGVKQVICDALFPVSQRYAWHFIGGHPMAGREYSGFKYARDDLFDHASMILCGHGAHTGGFAARPLSFS